MQMDVEMQNKHERPVGSKHMVENIIIERPQSGHIYTGHIDNYASPYIRPCDFTLVLRSKNDLGELKILK